MEDEWRPIESAPKDGTVILAIVPNPAGGFWWMLAEWDRHGRETWSCYWDGDPPRDQPTHWRSLPTPPDLPAEKVM